MVEIKTPHQRTLPNGEETCKVNKRIVCWIGDAPHHRALVAAISKEFNVVGVILDKKSSLKKKRSVAGFVRTVYDKWRFRKIDAAWNAMLQHYRPLSALPEAVPVLEVDTINDEKAFAFTRDLEPSLIIVSGTSLVKEPILSLPVEIGKMNLHTGLSPYVKGGPNCTNWCIANNEWHLIGNTVMWLSAGIDSGNIIATEQTDIANETDLSSIHRKLMEHAHDLYLRAIRYVIKTNRPYQSVEQSSLGKGKVYLTKMWTPEKKRQLLKNLSGRKVNSSKIEIRTVSLPD
jgi:methionyl-tRNA formyltransferase